MNHESVRKSEDLPLQQPVPLKGRALSLRDTVDIAVLQRIQDTFATAMGFAAVTVDRSGQPVTRDSCFLPVCRIMPNAPVQGLFFRTDSKKHRFEPRPDSNHENRGNAENTRGETD